MITGITYITEASQWLAWAKSTIPAEVSAHYYRGS